MKKISLIGISLVMVVFVGLIFLGTHASKAEQKVAPAHAATATVKTYPAPTKAELLALVNAERAKNNVAPLVEDARLDASAQRKADDEVMYNYFGHVSPHDGKHGYEYINDVNIYCKTDSENLTDNINPITDKPRNNTSQSAFNAWVSSKTHHEAMINPNYNLTGFGINGTQIVEHFCQQ